MTKDTWAIIGTMVTIGSIVEIQFAKVDQRLLTLERAIIPAADSDE